MLRRTFLLSGAGAVATLAQQKADDKKPDDAHVAGATQDPTPRVGILLSSFKEGEEHDGTKIPGLKDPQPPTADLTPVQFDAFVRTAIDLASLKNSQFYEFVEPEGWVVIKTKSTVDARIVGSTLSYVAEHGRGARFTVIDRLPQGGEWGQDYRKVVSDLSAKFSAKRFEILDLSTAPTADLPVPSKPAVTYPIPKVIQQCDTLISIAPLATDPAFGVSLSVGNYAALTTKPVTTDEALLDLFSYRPADLALVGGCWGFEGDGTRVHHNVLISGMKPVAVDSVAASVMGFKPADLPYLAVGQKRGFGSWDTDEIWTRGNEIGDARREFKKPTGKR